MEKFHTLNKIQNEKVLVHHLFLVILDMCSFIRILVLGGLPPMVGNISFGSLGNLVARAGKGFV